jgi:hypothetical protein
MIASLRNRFAMKPLPDVMDESINTTIILEWTFDYANTNTEPLK